MTTSAFGYIFATVSLPVGELFRGLYGPLVGCLFVCPFVSLSVSLPLLSAACLLPFVSLTTYHSVKESV